MNKAEQDKKVMVRYLEAWQKSPITFIKDIWDLTPQPLKPEFEELVHIYRVEDFKVDMFGDFIEGKHFTWQQWLILKAVENAINGKGSCSISVGSGHGIGKSACLSWLILWYLISHYEAQVGCTAPSTEQMNDVLWKELAIWINKMPEKFRKWYEWQTDHIRITASPKSWFARAKTARKETPEALAGLHGKHVMLIADEASGIDDIIFKTAEGALTGKNVLFLMVGNPTRNEGYFYRSHHESREYWQCLKFNSEESPIVDWGFIDKCSREYGKDSDDYKIRVLGEFANKGDMDTSGYISLFWDCDIKVGRRLGFVGETLRMGLDPSGEGDNKTVWVVRDQFRAYDVHSEIDSDERGIGAKSLTLLDYYKVDGKSLYIDNLGSGANVSKHIALSGIDTNPVSFADSPDDEVFLNKRAEMYFRAKAWIKAGGEICSKEIKEDLLKIKYKVLTSGKKQIMPKLEMRKQGISSPDFADAFVLTFYDDDTQYIKEKEQEEINIDFNPHSVI